MGILLFRVSESSPPLGVAMAQFTREDFTLLHSYWQAEDGSQQGPSDLQELKAAWKRKQLVSEERALQVIQVV